MNPVPSPYVALVSWGNALLRRHRPPLDLMTHPTFHGVNKAFFHLLDGDVLDTPNKWLEHLEEFHATRMSLVKFKVLDATTPDHVIVAPDLAGVWGIQVERRRVTELWLAGGAAGSQDLHYRGQPVPEPLEDGTELGAARENLDKMFREAMETWDDQGRKFLQQGLELLGGTTPPPSNLYAPDHPVDAQRVGWAAQFGWIISSKKPETDALRPRFEETLATATLAATNAEA